MFLNLDRIERRAAMRLASALGVAMGGEVDSSFFEALCDTEEEAKELHYEHAVNRRMAEARAKFAR
jgi:hypothetical protein